ncbi:MAG: hypothetical protein WA662_00375 [Pseudolabrys sp.]|jgi:hypothetical protein
MELKPLEERKAEFLRRDEALNQLGTLLPKPESLDAVDAAGVAEARWYLRKCGRCRPSLTQ